ncbi:MAG: hypothetical protein QM589_15945 [Thermomicrobiales bacterium]
MSNCPESVWQPFTTVMADNPDVAGRLLARIGAAMRLYVLEPAESLQQRFEDAVTDRAGRAGEYTLKVQQAPAIESSNEAWARKDYDSVVRALDPWEGRLPSVHARRLRFARSYLGEGKE